MAGLATQNKILRDVFCQRWSHLTQLRDLAAYFNKAGYQENREILVLEPQVHDIPDFIKLTNSMELSVFKYCNLQNLLQISIYDLPLMKYQFLLKKFHTKPKFVIRKIHFTCSIPKTFLVNYSVSLYLCLTDTYLFEHYLGIALLDSRTGKCCKKVKRIK